MESGQEAEVYVVAEDVGIRSLIWTALRDRASIDDEKITKDSERGDPKDDQRNGDIDLPEITRECATKKNQCDLQHQRQ